MPSAARAAPRAQGPARVGTVSSARLPAYRTPALTVSGPGGCSHRAQAPLLGGLPAPPPSRTDRSLRRLCALAHPGELTPRGVKVALGAVGVAAQLAARLLKHLGAGFQRGAQFVALARGIVPGPRGFCACGGGGALTGLRGLRARLVPCVNRGADLRLGAGPGLLDRLLRLRPVPAQRSAAYRWSWSRPGSPPSISACLTQDRKASG